MNDDNVFVFLIHNRAVDSVKTISIEPWASEYAVAPGSTLKMEIHYAGLGPLELVVGEDVQSVWTWKTASWVRVVVDGDEDNATIVG